MHYAASNPVSEEYLSSTKVYAILISFLFIPLPINVFFTMIAGIRFDRMGGGEIKTRPIFSTFILNLLKTVLEK